LPKQTDNADDPMRSRIRELQAEVERLRKAIDDHLATLDRTSQKPARQPGEGVGASTNES
jgi:hypothetical protein